MHCSQISENIIIIIIIIITASQLVGNYIRTVLYMYIYGRLFSKHLSLIFVTSCTFSTTYNTMNYMLYIPGVGIIIIRLLLFL